VRISALVKLTEEQAKNAGENRPFIERAVFPIEQNSEALSKLQF
jgi:hypothetical protein